MNIIGSQKSIGMTRLLAQSLRARFAERREAGGDQAVEARGRRRAAKRTRFSNRC
jgi:hypothetical protein